MGSLILDSMLLAVVASTPLLLAVEGEVIVQRSGIINLGLEGMMLVAALAAVVATQGSASIVAGFGAAVLAALAVAAIFGFCVITLRGDQVVTGTAINLFALGATGLAYGELQQRQALVAALPQPRFDAIVPFAWVVAPALLALLVWNTRFGLRLRACGENPEALTASGRRVSTYRWTALAIEGVAAGTAGAYLALYLSSGFAENMTAGRGFIALAIVIFGRWRFKGAILGTALFGFAAALQYALQAANRGVPFHLLLAVPYVVTLVILVVASGRVRAPESLGR